MKLKFILLGILICFGFNSCVIEKEDDPKTPTEILISGKWYCSSINMTSKIGSVSVEVIEVKYCQQDDYWEFYSDGRLRESVGLTKCEEEDENSYSSWKLSNNDKVLTIPYNDNLEDFSIKSIDDDKIILYIDKSGSAGNLTYSIKGNMTIVKKL